MSGNECLGVTTTPEGEVQIIIADKIHMSVELTPGAARRVAIKILEAISEAEWIAARNGVKK
jgi:hypothetical protein